MSANLSSWLLCFALLTSLRYFVKLSLVFYCNDGASGRNIADVILGLQLSLCNGQGYDGAGKMASKCNGASTRIQNHNPKALLVHCKSHVLNLCIASACTNQQVCKMMGHVKIVCEFCNIHPKRFAVLQGKISELLSFAKHNHLIDVWRTRWVVRIDGLAVFIETYITLVDAPDSIKNNLDGTCCFPSFKGYFTFNLATPVTVY